MNNELRSTIGVLLATCLLFACDNNQAASVLPPPPPKQAASAAVQPEVSTRRTRCLENHSQPSMSFMGIDGNGMPIYVLLPILVCDKWDKGEM